MKNVKVLPLNETGLYQDSDGSHYESKIVGLLIKEDEDNAFIIRAISEFDLREGFFDLDSDDGFIQFVK